MSSINFQSNGNLISGIYQMTLEDINNTFCNNSHRKQLFKGLKFACYHFKDAGCKYIFLDGSFVTTKKLPNDYDCCWDAAGVDFNLLDPILLKIDPTSRKAQKGKYKGEFFPMNKLEADSWRSFYDFFQMDKRTGQQKGMVEISLDELK